MSVESAGNAMNDWRFLQRTNSLASRGLSVAVEQPWSVTRQECMHKFSLWQVIVNARHAFKEIQSYI